MTAQAHSQSSSTDSKLIQSVYVQPDIRRGRITVYVNTSSAYSVTIAVPELDILVDAKSGRTVIPVDGFVHWTPDTPHQYSLICANPASEETYTVSFGMREFTVKENRFFFNGRPMYIKGVDGTAIMRNSPSSDTERLEMKSCFGSLKDAGYNLIRVSISDLTRDALAIADEIGLLVEVEFKESVELAGIQEFRNHPSVVTWNLLNLSDVDINTVLEADPSRLYLYRDSFSNTPCCVRPYRDDHQRIETFSLSHQAPVSRGSQSFCQHIGDHVVLSYVTHLNVGELTLDDAVALDAELLKRELDKIATGGANLKKKTRLLGLGNTRSLVDSIRTNGNVAGYCVGISDIGNTLRSLSDSLRIVNQAVALKLNHVAIRPLIYIPQKNLVPRQETPVKVHFLNEAKLEGRADLSLQVIGPTNQVLWKKKRGVRLPKSGKLIWEGDIAASGSTGKHRFVVRITQNFQQIAEASVDFFVYKPVVRWDGTINLLDPDKRWSDVCSNYVSALEFKSAMHIIPPITNSIRAYPDNDLAQILGQVNEGAVALFFQPPHDWNDFAQSIDPELKATPLVTNTVETAQIHYAKTHPVFDSLPSRTVMGATYGELMPAVTFQETSDEDICGAYRGTSFEVDERWGSNILVKKYGSGRIVFISLPIMEQLGQNPVADHLFVNLIKHFVRRSVPSQDGSFAVHQLSVEWIRQQRQDFTQHWAILGMFPWSPDAAKAPVYPPEESIDLTATYPGWYQALYWKSWFPVHKGGFKVDLDKALGPEFVDGETDDYGIAYAYAEVIGETRGEIRLVVDRKVRMAVYMNNTLVYSPENDDDDPTVYMKLGKNIVLVKLYKTPGPFSFKVNFETKKDVVRYRWWK
jgi:hypothetical protein